MGSEADTLIDPSTNRTFRHGRLLSCLQDWSADERILDVMGKRGLATPQIIVHMIGLIALTANGRGETGLSEREVAQHLVAFFLDDSQVRRQVARHLVKNLGLPKRQAVSDLKSMRDELMQFIGLRRAS